MRDALALPEAPHPWGEYDLADSAVNAVRIGHRELFLRAVDGEILLAHRIGAAAGDPADPLPEGVEPPEAGATPWSRWATPGGEDRVVLTPMLPDRTLVLEPERPFRLLPLAQAAVYVRVPLWIRVELELRGGRGEPGRRALLAEIPSVELSDTWWGGVMEGELGYWLPTTARRQMAPELFRSHLAVAPLLMANRSSMDLRIERLAFPVAHLSLFARGEELWTDEAEVVYQGDQEGSSVEMTGRPPKGASGAALLAPPRVPASKGLRAWTFERFRVLPGVGGA
jgi:hypothetical protein